MTRERDFVAEAITPEEYREGAGEGATPMPQPRNEAADRLRELVLAIARDEVVEVYESEAELRGMFDAALAEERRLVVAQIRERLAMVGDGNDLDAFAASLDEVAGESR